MPSSVLEHVNGNSMAINNNGTINTMQKNNVFYNYDEPVEADKVKLSEASDALQKYYTKAELLEIRRLSGKLLSMEK